MFNKLRKALERGLSPQDYAAYAAIEVQRRFSAFSGTLALRLKACLWGIELGHGVTACGPVIIGRWPGSRISIGNECSLVSSSRRATASTLAAPVRFRTFSAGACIELEQGVELSGTSLACRSTRIHIGHHTLIGPDCAIMDADFHALMPPETRHIEPGIERDAPVIIGPHVWIGLRSVVLKGVTIGEGAVVAAGSIVTRDIPPRTLAAGTPARVVRTLDGITPFQH